MNYCNPNHPFVVWASCFLWFISMFAIAWSLLLFFCVGDILFTSGTDLVNAVVLLSGIIMLPTNVHIICNIAHGKKINHNSKVVCCPMWLCIIWIMVINCVGAALCIYKIWTCRDTMSLLIMSTIKNYRSVPKYKHFIDNLQWSLRCCGLKSYKDWFDYDWYDKIRDYEWEPSQNKRYFHSSEALKTITDSVPLSCCKSGSCISNYLLELGTSTINTRGCGDLMYHMVLYSMIIHLIMFVLITIVEGLLLKLITTAEITNTKATRLCEAPCAGQSERTIKSHRSLSNMFNIRHIMPIKDNYSASSASVQINPDDSDEFERAEQLSLVPKHMLHARMDTYRDLTKIDDECPESP